MKQRYSVPALVIILFMIFYIFSVYGEESETEKCRTFLKGFGWRVSDTPSDEAEISIPSEFDEVYKSYNAMQKKSGLDLMEYSGKSGRRYTFEVLNYPIDAGETVYANVICIDGKAVGGDIMTVSLSGFMHSLNENTPEK